MCDLGRRLYARNLVAATDGNLSVRLGDDRYLCTPSGVSKGTMAPEDLVIADSSGHLVEGRGKVTSEFFTHLAAYEERPDISAVVHAHPLVATALTIAGFGMMEPILPEVVFALGEIPTAEYATPGTKEGAGVVRGPIRHHDAVLLDKHGAITVGKSLLEAYLKMEKLEHAAQVIMTARLLGNLTTLDTAQIGRIQDAADAYGKGV